MLTVADTSELLVFLLTKPSPRLRTATVCASDKLVDRGPGRPPGPCTRPAWGNGSGIQGRGAGLCSRCWHEWNAIHGVYRTLRANPAAADISNEGLARLFITRGLDAEPLPELGTHLPDTLPASWDTAG
jgi:hypothetical protein